MSKSPVLISIALLLFCQILPAVAQVAGTQPASKPKGDYEIIADELGSGDTERERQALALIDSTMVKVPRFIRMNLRRHWVTPLINAKRFDDVERLAMRSIMNDPSDTVGCADMQYCRIQALTAAGKDEQALSEAKTFYNICPLKQTQDAIGYVTEALANTRTKQDETIVRRFKQQQAAGAGGAGGVAGAGDQPASQPAAALGENVLKTIPVDPAPYQQRIEALSADRVNFNNLSARGNLLLLADRPAEARKAFELAADLANAKQMAAAVENVARALRAEEGTVAAANNYIMSLRNQAN